MPAYAIDGVTPVVHPTAFVHPTAVLIGDVIVGPGCYIGPIASLRGDFGRLIVGEGANIQDTCVLHGFPHTDTIVEANGHVGHGAILHGCHIGENVLVGMNAVVMDGAVVGESSIIAAMAFIKAKTSIPPRSLVAGIPARVIRPLTADEIAWKSQGTATYQDLAIRSLRTMQPVQPLTEAEPDRKRVSAPHFEPLYAARQRFAAEQEAPQTAENICRACQGAGQLDGKPCPECGGTGRVVETVGDA